MNELTVRDGNHLPSKAVLGSYVHDAAEMEFDLLTLEKSRDELKEKILGERSRNIRKEMGSFVPKQHLEKRPLQHEVLENTSSLKFSALSARIIRRATRKSPYPRQIFPHLKTSVVQCAPPTVKSELKSPRTKTEGELSAQALRVT
jgi:hypothetical protein